MDSPKPILVTGATGCIGSVLVKRLSETGGSVRVVVRNPDRAAKLRSMPNVEIILGDLTRPDSLRDCAEGCSLVYHCAAQLRTPDWARSYATNVAGTQVVLNEAARAGVERLIYTSTIGVYGLIKAENITEETPWSKYNQPYFSTKQEAERVVWQAVDQIPIAIARLGDVMGPGQYTWTIDPIQKMNRGLFQPPLDSESGFVNPVYIDNLVDALLLMGVHPAAPGQIFNVVDGTPIRAGDYYRRLAQMTGRKLTPLPALVLKGASTILVGYDLLRGREPSFFGSIDYLLRKGKIYPNKIQSLLGWAPAIPQEEAFRRTEQWLRQEGYLRGRQAEHSG
jgi:nucleoside-diphosphate-sugar epimerase